MQVSLIASGEEDLFDRVDRHIWQARKHRPNVSQTDRMVGIRMCIDHPDRQGPGSPSVSYLQRRQSGAPLTMRIEPTVPGSLDHVALWTSAINASGHPYLVSRSPHRRCSTIRIDPNVQSRV